MALYQYFKANSDVKLPNLWQKHGARTWAHEQW